MEYVGHYSENELFKFYNELNKDKKHHNSNDDICTPMECVKTMIDYVPKELWNRDQIKVLDPCCGNGNFGAYTKTKTSIDNIHFNDLNTKRYLNTKALLKPKNITNLDMFFIQDKYDLIMANPPYSGGINKNKSLSNAIIERSIDLLNDNGYLCFITPNNWMTYNNKNTTLKKLLNEGSFLIIDNDAKKYFPSVGSSFTIFVWQKNVFNLKTTVRNNFVLNDIQEVSIPKNSEFIPLYLSNEVISITNKLISEKRNNLSYRCDLHNHTQRHKLSDQCSATFPYETIHTPNKTRYSSFKQDTYEKWSILIPLSTYYIPYIRKNVNITQSMAAFHFDNKSDAESYLSKITKPEYKFIIHITRYGNFNNTRLLKFLNFNNEIQFTKMEVEIINKITEKIKY